MAKKFDPSYRPPNGTQICRLADLPDETARSFILEAPDNRHLDIIVWRRGDQLRGFVNQCPHLGLPLETFPDRFLSTDGRYLICSAHGAQFDAQGHCIAGPCLGERLTPLGLVLIESKPKNQPENQKSEKMIVLSDIARHS